VFARCQDRLDEMVRLMRRSTKGPANNGEGTAGNGEENEDTGGGCGDRAHTKGGQ